MAKFAETVTKSNVDNAIRLKEQKQAERLVKMNKKIRKKRKEPLGKITKDDLKKYWEEKREKIKISHNQTSV